MAPTVAPTTTPGGPGGGGGEDEDGGGSGISIIVFRGSAIVLGLCRRMRRAVEGEEDQGHEGRTSERQPSACISTGRNATRGAC